MNKKRPMSKNSKADESYQNSGLSFPNSPSSSNPVIVTGEMTKILAAKYKRPFYGNPN